MKKIQFKNNKNDRILKILNSKFPEISYSAFSSVLRKKDILVNGQRIKENIKVQDGDYIIFFIPENKTHQLFEIFYEDENLIIVNKKKGIEVCDGENNIQTELLISGKNVIAVHRIDKNTSGLVLFARNSIVEKILRDLMKLKKIQKYYLAKVFGLAKQSEVLEGYLLKDNKNSHVKIFDKKIPNGEKIITPYKLVSYDKNKNISIIEVNLHAGKTHQIRAHLAHVSLPIVGDGKYGNNEKNRNEKKNKQCLTAYKLEFNIPEDNLLYYLNGKVFEVNDTDM